MEIMCQQEHSGLSLRQRIIVVAQRLFVLQGYHNTSMNDIVREAGVSTGAIYHHFQNKNELAKEIHQLAVKEFLTRWVQVDNKTTAQEQIYAYVNLMFSLTEENPIMVEYLLHARPKEALNKAMAICSVEGLEKVKKIVIDGIKNNEIKAENVDACYAVLSGTVARMIELRWDKLIDFPLTDVTQEIANNMWLALKK